MATTLGSLILELGIDDSKIAGQLADAKRKAITAATGVEKDLKKLKIQDAISTSPEIDNSEFSPKLQKLEEDIYKLSDRIEARLNSLDASNVNKQLHLVPTVDHEPLEELNAHLDRKLKHVLTLNQEFALNPLRVTVDSRDLDTLSSKLNNIGNRTQNIEVTTERIGDIMPLSEEDIYKKLRRELDDTGGVPTVSSQATTAQKLENTSKVNDLESVMSDLIQQNEGLALSNQNLALAMRGLDSSIQANSAAANDMPIKMSKIIHTSSKETLMDKITGFPARVVESVVFGAIEGTGAQLAYDFVKGTQTYLEKKTGVNTETLGYNFGRYGYNRAKGFAMVGAEAMGYRGGLKEVGDDIAYLGKRLDSFLDPRQVVARLKGFEDLVVATLEDVYTYNDPERAKDRVVEYFKPEVEELKEGAARAAGVGLRVAATPFRIRKRANLATSMEYSRILAESMEVPDIPDVENKKAIALVSGGVDLKEGGPNTYMATAMLKNLFGDQVATVPVPNSYSNDADMMGAQKMLRQILANIAADFTGNEDIRAAGDAIAMDRLYNIAYEAGFNPDAIAMEATRLAYQKKYGSDKQFIFAGTSAGTTVAEEATAISERAGATNVKGFGATLPLTGLTNTASKENFKAFVGTLDPMFLALMGKRLTDEGAESKGTLKILEASLSHFPAILQTMIKEKWNSGLMAPSSNTEVIEGAGLLHNLGPFLANEEFQSRLSDFLGIQLSDDAKGRAGQSANKSYADMFGELDALSRTLRALQGDKTALDEIRRFEETGGEEGGYGFVTSDLQLKKSSGPSQEKYDLEYALDNFRNSGKGGKAPSKQVTGTALEDANLFQTILEDMISVLKESTADLAGQRENLARTFGILQGNEADIADAQSGKYAYVTPEGQLKKSFGESQEKYDLEYAIDEFDTKGDGELEKVKSLMQGIVDLTKDADSLDDTKLNSLVSDMQEMINSVSEINLIEIEKLMAKLGEIFGVAPSFDQFTIQDIEDLAQGRKSFTQLREEAKARGEEFPEGTPQPIEERVSNLPARKFQTTETRTRDIITNKKQQEQEFNRQRREAFASIYGDDTDLALALYPNTSIDTLEQINNNQKSTNALAFEELSRLNLENNTQTLDLSSVNAPTIDNILSPVNISQPELQTEITSSEEAINTGSEMALSFMQGVGTGLANVAESAGNAMATATENKLVSLVNRLMRRVPGDPNSIDANAPTIDSLSDIGPEQIAKASALGIEDAATALTNVAKGGVAAARALINVSKAAGVAITGAQPAATEFIESSRQRMQAIKSSVNNIRANLTSAPGQRELPPEVTRQMQYLMGSSEDQGSGYIDRFLADLDSAINQLEPQARTQPLEGNQLSNLKSQGVKAKKTLEQIQAEIEEQYNRLLELVNELQKENTDIIDGEVVSTPNEIPNLTGQQQVAQLTAAKPPPNYERMVKQTSDDFVQLKRVVENKKGQYSQEQQQAAAQEILRTADEAYKAITDLQESIGDRATIPLKNLAKAAKGQITSARNAVNKSGINVSNVSDQTAELGQNVAEGFPEGFSDRISNLKAESERLIQGGIIDPMAKGLKIQSPSKVTEYLGNMAAQGFIKGLESVGNASKIINDSLNEVKKELEAFSGDIIKLSATPLKLRKELQLDKSSDLAKELAKSTSLPEIENIDQKEYIALVSGGIDGNKGDNTYFARNVLQGILGDKVATVPVPNEFSNSDQFGNLAEIKKQIINILSSVFGAEDIKKMAEANSLDKLMLFAAEAGFNPDAIRMEATRMAYQEKYPDKKFIFAGTSGGTLAAEEATAIASRTEEDVKGFGLTYPLTGLTQTAPQDKFKAFVGDQDPIYMQNFGIGHIDREKLSKAQQKMMDAALDSMVLPPNLLKPSNNTEVIEGAGQAHHLGQFASNEELHKRLSSFLNIDLDEDFRGKQGTTNFKQYTDMFSQFDSLRRTLGVLLGNRDSIMESIKGQYSFVTPGLKPRKTYGEAQEKSDIEYAASEIQIGNRVSGKAREDALAYKKLMEELAEILTSSDFDPVKIKTLKDDFDKLFGSSPQFDAAIIGDIENQAVGQGKNLLYGLEKGLNSDEPVKTIEIVATEVIDTIKKVWEISSPSKKGFNLGRWLAEGIKQGIEKTLDVSASIGQVSKDLYSMADMYQENLGKAFDSKVITDELAILRDSITDALTAFGQLEDANPAIQNAKTAAGRIINYPNEAIVAKYKEDVRFNAQRILTEPPDPDTHPAAHNIPADAKKVIFVSSGFTGTKGRISNEIAGKLEPMAPEGTHMVPFENKNFDVSGTLDEAGIARVVMDAIIMPMKAVKRGVNEEALRLAKQAYAVKQERPDIELGFVGHSAGGFIVREAQEILRAMEIFSQALSMGTPLLGAFQAIKPNTVSLMGEGDQLRMFTGQKEAIVPGVSGHFSPHYLDESNEMREILTKYLHDGITPELISRIHELGSAIQGLEPGNSGPVMRFDRIRQGGGGQRSLPAADSTSIGQNIGKGLAVGIDAGAKEALEAANHMADAVIDITESTFEIASPSRWATRIGGFIGQGLVNGLESAKSKVKGAVDGLKESTSKSFQNWIDSPTEDDFVPIEWNTKRPEADIPIIGGAYAFVLDSMESMKNMATALPEIGRGLAGVFEGVMQNTPAIMNMAKGFLVFDFIIKPLISSLMAFEEVAFQTAVEMENMTNVIELVSGSAAEGAKNIAFVRSQVQALGGDMRASMEGFSQLGASAQGTRLEGEGTRQIFSAVSQAALVYQMDPEAQGRAYTALSQMMDKSVVSAEELRGQLAESLPGAIAVAARAMGVSTQELGKMMEMGEVMAEDLLPRFAQQLSAETAGGLAGSARSAQSSINKLNNEMLLLQEAYGKTTIPLRIVGMDTASAGLKLVRENILALSVALTALIVTLLKNSAVELVKFLGKFAKIEAVMNLIKNAAANLFKFLIPMIKQLGMAFLKQFLLLTAVGDVFTIFQKGFGDASSGMMDTAKSTTDAWQSYLNVLEEARKKQEELSKGDSSGFSFERFKESGGVDSSFSFAKNASPLGYLMDVGTAIKGEDSSTAAGYVGRLATSVLGFKQIIDISKDAKNFFTAFVDGIGIRDELRNLMRDESLIESTLVGSIIGQEASRVVENGFRSFAKSGTDGDTWHDYVNPVNLVLGGLKNVGLDLGTSYGDIQRQQRDIAVGEQVTSGGNIQQEARTTLFDLEGNASNDLAKVVDLDEQYRQAQQRRAALPREAIEEQRKAEEEINRILEERGAAYQAVGKQQANLQLSVENYKAQIKSVEEELATLGNSDQDNERRQQLQGQLTLLKSNMNDSQLLLDNINAKIGEAAGRVELLARQFRLVNAELQNASYALELQTAQQQAMIAAIPVGQEGLRQGTSNVIQREQLAEKIGINANFINQTQTLLNDQEYIQILESAGLKATSTAADIAAKVEELADGSLKTNLTKIQEAKEQLQQTELESAQLGAQMAELKQQLDEQFFQMGLELENMMIEIGQQAEMLEADFKAAANDRNIQSAARNIGRSMKLLRTDHFSGFMGLLEEFVNVLGEQLRTTADFLRQKIELTQNLFNQLRQNDMFNLGIPQVDGSVVGGGQPGQGSGQAVASPLIGQSIDALVNYQPTPGQSFTASRNRNGRRGAHAGIDWDSRVGGGRGADVAAAVGGRAQVIDIGEQDGDNGNSVQVRISTQDAQGIPVELQFNHLELNSVREALGIGIGGTTNVATGQMIGEVINHHLDMKVKVNGQFVDAQQWLAAMNAGGGTARNLQGQQVRINPVAVQQSPAQQQQSTQVSAPRVSGPGRVPRGGTVRQAERVQSDPAGAQALVATAQRLGLDPREFAALMSWESAGSFNPNIRGGDGNQYKGLIQFSPSNQQRYGTGGQQSIAQQMPAIERYLIDRGFQPGQHDIRHAYSAILAGQAGERYWNRRDSNGTSVRNAAPRFQRGEHRNRAEQFLRDSGVNFSGGGASVAASAPPRNTEFERFMREGYALTERRDFQSALINFRRAAELQPNNRYATEAIRNVTGYINQQRSSTSSSVQAFQGLANTASQISTGGARPPSNSAMSAREGSQPPVSVSTGGGSPTPQAQPQQPIFSQSEVASVTAQSQGLVQSSSNYRTQLIDLNNQQIAEINRLQQFANQQFNLDLGNIVSRSQQEAVVKQREVEDTQRLLQDQNEDRAFNATPEYARTPEMIAQQDTREATRAARDEGIQIDRQIEDLRFDMSEVERRLPETISILRGLNAPEDFVNQMEQAGQSVISSAREKIAVLEQQRGNVDTFLTDTVNRIAAETQRALENTQFQNASDIANLNADLMEEQATRADQTNNPQEAARLRAGAEEVRAIRANEELIRDLQQRMEADPTNAAQYQEQIDIAQQKIAVSLENLNETFRRTSEEIAQYNFSASRESSREVRGLEIQQLRFNGDPMQALIMEQEDELNAQLDGFAKRRLEIAADLQLDAPTRAQLEADLAEIEAMTIQMSAELMIRAQVDLEIANENALLNARSTNLQALIPNLNANYEQGRARDMQAELDGLMIEQRLRETLHSIEDPSNNLTAETREHLKLLAEETAELERQNLEREHALNIRRDQIELDRNTITNPGGPQALAQVQDEYLGMYGITPTWQMRQERLPMQLEMQNLNYQQQLIDLEELRNSGKLTQEAFEKAKVSLEAMNNIKLDQLKIEASGIPEIVNAVKSPIKSFFTDILDPSSTKTFGEAFSDMINGMLANLAQLAAEWVTNSLFSSIFGGGAGSPGKEGGLFSGLFGGMFGGEEEQAATPVAAIAGVGGGTPAEGGMNGLINLADSVFPGTAALMGEGGVGGDPGIALSMGGQEASMAMAMGGQEAGMAITQAGHMLSQSVSQAAMTLSSAGMHGAGGIAGLGSSLIGGEGGNVFSSLRRGANSFDLSGLGATFDRGAATIGNSILKGSERGGSIFSNIFSGGGSRSGGGLLSGLFGGGGSTMGGATGGGGFLSSLLNIGMSFLFNQGGEVTKRRSIEIPNFAKGGKLGGIADNAIAEAFKRERPYGKPRLIMANEGEWVLNRKQQAIAKSMGVDERLLNFAGGGIVGSRSMPTPTVNTSNIGGATRNVSVPITINSSGGNEEEDAKMAQKLKGPIEGLVRGILNREGRFGGSMSR